MPESFRFVIQGSGNIAATYAEVLDRVDEAELAGVVSRGGIRPAFAGEAVEVARSLSGLETPFDGVILATPNGVHHDGAIEAAGLGKHVLTEKVLDVSRANMDRMTQACRDAGVTLGVAFQRRMSPDNRAVRKLLQQGDLGRVFAAELAVKFYRDQAYYDSAAYRGTRDVDGGGPFMQQAAHNIDIYVWFFGMPARVVSMLDTFAHRIEGEDHGAALLRHPGGMIGSITASTCCKPGFPARLALHAEAGSVVLENDCITQWDVEGRPNPGRAAGFAVHSGASSAAVSETAGHEAIVRDFVAAVHEGREPAVPAESARLTTELVLRIYDGDVG